MRLIDADKLLMLINEQKEKETGSYSKGRNEGLNIAKSIINDEIQTPIAYDVDKIIKELESWTFNIDIDIDGTMVNRNLIVSDTAIDIVKAGGKNE